MGMEIANQGKIGNLLINGSPYFSHALEDGADNKDAEDGNLLTAPGIP
jgi:hypothetical protein